MTETKIVTIKKTFIVIIALIIGYLMPYISRIPLAFKYGMPWIWKYMGEHFEDILRWNVLHIFSLVAIIVFGALFIFSKLKWQFYGSVIAHLAITSLVYYNFTETYHPDDFLECIFFPPVIAFFSGLGGLLGLGVELIIKRGKTSQKKNSFSQ